MEKPITNISETFPADKRREGRMLERAVQNECQIRAGELVDGAIRLYSDALEYLKTTMKNPDTPPAVASANARFIVQYVTQVVGLNAHKAEKGAVPAAVIQMEDAVERASSDPEFARNLLS